MCVREVKVMNPGYRSTRVVLDDGCPGFAIHPISMAANDVPGVTSRPEVRLGPCIARACVRLQSGRSMCPLHVRRQNARGKRKPIPEYKMTRATNEVDKANVALTRAEIAEWRGRCSGNIACIKSN